MEHCETCGKELTQNELGLSRKLVNRGTAVFWCIDCLSEKLGIPVPELEEFILRMKEQGCTLFE